MIGKIWPYDELFQLSVDVRLWFLCLDATASLGLTKPHDFKMIPHNIGLVLIVDVKVFNSVTASPKVLE